MRTTTIRFTSLSFGFAAVAGLMLPYLGGVAFLEVKLSLSIVFMIVLVFAWWHVFYAKWSLANSSVIVFFVLFFYLAPVLQLYALDKSSTVIMVNTLRFNASLAVTVNYCVAAFLLTYWGGYIVLHRYKRGESQTGEAMEFSNWKVSPTMLLFAFLSLLPLTVPYLLEGWQKVFTLDVARGAETEGIYKLFVAKVFAVLPLLGSVISLHLARHRKRYYLLAMVFLALLFLFKNPVFERRNAIGAVYLTLIATQLVWLNRSNLRSMLFGLFVMAVMFPMAAIVTNVDYSRELPSVEDVGHVVTGHYTELHYDSWANSQAIVERVGREGPAYGEQLAGVLFFFVPRSIWNDKPIGTGKEVGIYLMDNYAMWFDNLSAPLPFEGFYDFGIVGVFAMALILAAVVVVFEARIGISPFDRVFYLFFSFSLYFILRGDLLASFAYTVGAFASLVLIPRLFRIAQAKLARAGLVGLYARSGVSG